MSLDIVTDVPESFLREFEAEILGQIPAEKVKADLDGAKTKQFLVNEGAVAIEGLGQKLGEIPARTYFRWLQDKPGCWQDREFTHEFFKDNGRLKSDGWTPVAAKGLRHGFTYVNGEPVRAK